MHKLTPVELHASGELGIQSRNQGHFDMQIGGARDHTTTFQLVDPA